MKELELSELNLFGKETFDKFCTPTSSAPISLNKV